MAFALDIKRRVRAIVAPVVFLAITGYFVWSVTQGNRGLVAFAERQDLLHQVQKDNDDCARPTVRCGNVVSWGCGPSRAQSGHAGRA